MGGALGSLIRLRRDDCVGLSRGKWFLRPRDPLFVFPKIVSHRREKKKRLRPDVCSLRALCELRVKPSFLFSKNIPVEKLACPGAFEVPRRPKSQKVHRSGGALRRLRIALEIEFNNF